MLRRRAAAALLLCSLLAPHAGLTVVRAQQPAATPTPQRPAAAPSPSTAERPSTPAQTSASPQPSPAATPSNDPVERIKDEALNRSRAMETLTHLTEVIGPRLTNSPAMRRANEWTRDRLTSWGLQNARLEPWGPFGRGWTLKRFSAEVTGPVAFPLVAYPKAWSPGTQGPLDAEVMIVEAKNEAELQQYKGRLRGAAVLVGNVRELRPLWEPKARRSTDKELLDLANAPDPATQPRRPQRQPSPADLERARFNDRLTRFLYDEGVVLLVDSSRAGDGGMLQFVQSASVPQAFDTPPDKRVAPWSKDAPRLIPQFSVSNDHYNRMARMIRAGQKVRLNVNLEVEFDDRDLMGYNTVAEILGTDLKDEVVMIGAHMDSWHTGTGATDNAVGVAIMMEAVRLIKVLNLQPRRTIRIALWSGEEQGLLGSRAYVREHFGPVTGAAASPSPTPATPPVYKLAYEKFNVYYNADSGTGLIRGIYLQGNEALRPLFRRWLQPFNEMKIGNDKFSATTVTVANAGGSDFLAFDAVGLPGLDFLQDEIEYGTRTWHSNQDTLDRILPDDVKHSAAVVAAFAYNSAMTDEKLPRKPQRANAETRR